MELLHSISISEKFLEWRSEYFMCFSVSSYFQIIIFSHSSLSSTFSKVFITITAKMHMATQKILNLRCPSLSRCEQVSKPKSFTSKVSYNFISGFCSVKQMKGWLPLDFKLIHYKLALSNTCPLIHLVKMKNWVHFGWNLAHKCSNLCAVRDHTKCTKHSTRLKKD